MRADALDHARTKIALNAFAGAGWHHAQLVGFELSPMAGIDGPLPARVNVLAGGDLGGIADHGDQLAFATDFDS